MQRPPQGHLLVIEYGFESLLPDGRCRNRNKYEFIFTKSKKLGQYEFVKEKRKMGLVGLGRRKNEARHLPFNGYGTYLTA